MKLSACSFVALTMLAIIALPAFGNNEATAPLTPERLISQNTVASDASQRNATMQPVSPSASDALRVTDPSAKDKASPLLSLSESQLASGSVLAKLSNGMTVLVKQDTRFPLVSLRLYVRAGSSYESPDEAGISHVLEHMVFKGTTKYPKGSIAGAVESTGGYLNAATSFDYTVYLTDMTSSSWKEGLDALKEMVFHPTLDPAELESEKDVIVAELKRGQDSPGSRLFEMMQTTLFPKTPYGHPIIGYESTIRSFTSEKIRSYITKHYEPQSMLLLVCGNVSLEEAMKEAEASFGSLKNNHPVVADITRESTPDRNGYAVNMQTGPWQKVHLALAFPAPAMDDTRSSQLDVLADLLGGGTTSRFYRTYKYEKRLVDAIGVSSYSFENHGLIFVQVTLAPEKLVPFWKEFLKDFKLVDSYTYTQNELDRTKLNIENSLFESKATISGLASKAGYFQFFFHTEGAEANYLRVVNDTDQTIINSLAKDIFSPEKVVLTGLFPDQATAETYKLPAGFTSVEKWMEEEFISVIQPKAELAAQGKAIITGDAEAIDLGNNRTLILLPDKTLPYAAATLMFAGGDSLLSKGSQGLGAFTASLVTKGAGTHSAEAIQEFLADRASSLQTSSSRQSFSVNLYGPSRFTKDLFSMLHDIIATPRLETEEGARVTEGQLANIVATEDNPTGFAFRRLFAFLFPDHPYGFLQLGEKETVKKFTPKEARAFWALQTKQPWVLAVCGSFDKAVILDAAKKLPVPDKKAQPIPSVNWGKEKELELKLAGRTQAHLMMVFPTVPYASPDSPGLMLLQNILAGQSGLLFRDLRDEQGLGYSVTAFPWESEKAGTLIFYIGTEPAKMAQAEAGFKTVIERLKAAPLDQTEITRGKNQMTGDYYRNRQRMSTRSAEAASLSILGHPLDSGLKRVEAAKDITAEQLQELAKKYLDLDKVYLVKVLP